MGGQGDAPVLELKEVAKAFGGLLAVNRVSTSIKKGEIVSVIGPNGAGKTTLINLITGFLPLKSGEICFKGRRLNGLAPPRICSLGIARTFQAIQLFGGMSVLENVMIGRHRWSPASVPEVAFRLGRARREEAERRDRAMEKLALLGLDKRASISPLSLPFKERKLLGVARALATEPELLLLDEPVGGVSVGEMNEIIDVVLGLREKGLTIILVEHRMEMVMRISDRIVVLNFGQKIAEGTPAEIQRNEKVITAYLGEGD